MNETILTLGVVFVATAIVGGGVSLMNNKMPVVDSPRRQVLLGGFGLLIIVLDYALLGNVKNSVATLPSPSVSSTPVIGLSSSPNPTPTPLPSATPAPSISSSSLPVSPSESGVATGNRVVSAGPRSWQSHGFTLTVDRVEAQGNSIYVVLRAANTTGNSLLMAKGYLFLVDDMGKSYVVDGSAGTWPDTVPPGTTVAGTVALKGPLTAGTKTLSAGFSQIYGAEFENITIPGIVVSPG